MADSELSPKFAPFIGMVRPPIHTVAITQASDLAPADNFSLH